MTQNKNIQAICENSVIGVDNNNLLFISLYLGISTNLPYYQILEAVPLAVWSKKESLWRLGYLPLNKSHKMNLKFSLKN